MRRILTFYNLLSSKSYSTLAGTISFFIIINGGPILFLAFIFLNYLELDININVPSELITSILNNVRSTQNMGGVYPLFFVLTSLWSSSTLFYHFIKTGEFLYDKKKDCNIFSRVLAIIFVILFLVLLVSIFIIFYIITKLALSINIRLIYKIIEIILCVSLPILIIIFLNLFIPPVKMKFRYVIKGSFFTLFFWIIISFLFMIYLKYFANFKEIYGALATIIIFMIWVYLISIGLVIGFIINQKNWLNLENIK